MKILVIGGAGFIGSHVVDGYIEAGHEVAIVDDMSTGNWENLNPKAKFHQVDMLSDELEKVFDLEKPEIVNHHAAQKSIPDSVEDPVFDAKLNVIGLLNVLELSVKYKVKKFIFISSGGALVGDAPVVPTDEKFEPILISPYAITKYVAEKYLHYYQVTHGLTYVVLRYANVYGPRQVAKGECGVIPIFLDNYFANQPSTLFAYADQPKGTTRDYVYVDDIKRANILALTRGENEVLNIGSGVELHIEDIYMTIKEVLGHDLPLHRKSERVGDVKRSCLDSSKAEEVLGWKAEVDLEEGIKRFYQHYLETTQQK